MLWGHKGGAVGEFPDVSWHCWLFCELHTGSNHCFLWSRTLIACIKRHNTLVGILVYYCIFFIVFLEVFFVCLVKGQALITGLPPHISHSDPPWQVLTSLPSK